MLPRLLPKSARNFKQSVADHIARFGNQTAVMAERGFVQVAVFAKGFLVTLVQELVGSLFIGEGNDGGLRGFCIDEGKERSIIHS